MKTNHPAPSDIPGLRQLWQQAFGDDDAFLDHFFAAAFAPERCLCMAAGEKIAAALYWFDCSYPYGKLAYIYAVATHPDCRGQGLCRQLMKDAHRHLAARGYAGTVLVPGQPELFAMYEKMGYLSFSGMDCFPATASAPIPLLPLTASAYAKKRRDFLPENGVLQEQENLAFFSRFARFYEGENFVLAVSGGADTCTAVELLGDASAAPGILGALQTDTGTFRVPGSHPFAMFFSLTGAPAPGYFGLAFD